MQKNEQEARLKILEDKLKEPEFSEKFLSFEKIEEVQAFCKENGVDVTVDELQAILDNANKVMSELELENVSGGINIDEIKELASDLREGVVECAKEEPVKTGVVGTVVVYDLVAACVKIATKGRHDYTPVGLLKKGINAIKSKISGK